LTGNEAVYRHAKKPSIQRAFALKTRQQIARRLSDALGENFGNHILGHIPGSPAGCEARHHPRPQFLIESGKKFGG
jgi:hypothetical protein